MPKQKKCLIASIATSLTIHLAFFIFLQIHSVWLNVPAASSKPFSLEAVNRDQILKESFAAPFSETHRPMHEKISQHLSHLPIDPMTRSSPQLFTTPSTSPNLLSSNAFPIRTFPIPLPQHLDLFGPFKDLIVPTLETSLSPKLFTPQFEKGPLVETEKILTHLPTLPSISFTSEVHPLPPPDTAKAPPPIPLPILPEVPTLADLETVNLSDSFEMELSFSPRPDGPGYLFALTLIPREDLQIPSLKQHFIFLIDRSNSIQHERLIATKTAVSKAIEELEAGDSFNIIAFDHKMEKLSPSFLKISPETLTKTNEFLNKIQLGSFFSPGDLYRPLFITIPSLVEEDEVYTAILLTDGESLSKKRMQESFARDWTLQNQGRISLYALSMETDTHLGTIDAACHFNKGRLLYVNSHRGLKRKLLRLTQNIKHPIAKNIAFKAISKNPQAKIDIYPNPTAPIYLDQPYVLLGSTETPDDFILFVQGKLKNQWLNIKKTISFVNAKKGGNFLKSEWALQKAYQKYENYLLEGDQKYLIQAKELLEPFHLQIAFQ